MNGEKEILNDSLIDIFMEPSPFYGISFNFNKNKLFLESLKDYEELLLDETLESVNKKTKN